MENEDKIFNDIVSGAGTIMAPAEIEARAEMGDEAYEKLRDYLETNQAIALDQGKARTRILNGMADLYVSVSKGIDALVNKYLGS